MRPSSRILLSASFLAVATFAQAGHFVVELGGYLIDTGEEQDIEIVNLLGDTYTIDSSVQGSVIGGVGYYFDIFNQASYEIDIGLNAFYLFQTQVSGEVVEEHRLTNLAYDYEISHLPIYLAAKALIETGHEKYKVTLDAGIGPNFIFTGDYDEHSLDGMTLPNHAYEGKTTTVFSAMAGIGVQFADVFGSRPMECGYRFFYLGTGELDPRNWQIEDSLSTGPNYANALFCTASI